jgi:hypothetical protein
MNVTSPYVQTGLTNGTTYHYILTAVNNIGEGPPCSEVFATPTVTAPAVPAAPTGVIAVGGTNQVTVTWNTVTGATSYNVYYSTTTGVTIGGTGVTKLAGVTSPDIVTGLAASTTYFFIVTAVNSAGESVASSQAQATTLVTPPSGVPSAPTGVAAISGLTNSVRINWTAVTGATSYNIYRGTATGVTTTSGTKIPVSGGTTATFLDSDGLGVGLAASTQYFYIMTAVNASGESLPSTEVNATTQTLDGVALYTANCTVACHAHGTTLANSSFKPGGRTAAQITSAISGVSAMNFLSTLTPAQIQAIADVLTFELEDDKLCKSVLWSEKALSFPPLAKKGGSFFLKWMLSTKKHFPFPRLPSFPCSCTGLSGTPWRGSAGMISPPLLSILQQSLSS